MGESWGNAVGMEVTALLMASHPLSGGTMIPIAMLISHTGLGMDIVKVEHTIPPDVDMTEVTAGSSMKTTQIVMLNGHTILGMDFVNGGIQHTIPPNVDLTEAIACKSIVVVGHTIPPNAGGMGVTSCKSYIN